MERYGDTGQYYNWYDHRTGAKLTDWPPTERDPNFAPDPVLGRQRLAGRRAEDRREQRAAAARAAPARSTTRWTSASTTGPSVNRVLFHFRPDDPAASPCCYDTVVSESRIVDYIGIAAGQLPQKEYYGRWRTFPDTCDWCFQETKPVGDRASTSASTSSRAPTRTTASRSCPSWGGSMFEALMPALFVPEEQLGAAQLGRQPPAHGAGPDPPRPDRGRLRLLGLLAGQHARGRLRRLRRRRRPAWTPTACPPTRTTRSSTTASRAARTRPAKPDPPPSAYTNGVVTPHAAFLALRYAPAEARANLRRLARDFPGLYGNWGFRDSVNVQTGRVSDSYLSLDQGMIMAALGNALGGDVLRRAFADRELGGR